jgi:hypothetical protein
VISLGAFEIVARVGGMLLKLKLSFGLFYLKFLTGVLGRGLVRRGKEDGVLEAEWAFCDKCCEVVLGQG